MLDYVLVPALLYLIAGLAMSSFIPAIPLWAWVVAFVIVNTAVNYLGIEMTARVSLLMLAFELVVLAIFVVGRCDHLRRRPGRLVRPAV